MPMASKPNRFAAASVVPDPMNGSRTGPIDPDASRRRLSRFSGFSAGWPDGLCDAQGSVHTSGRPRSGITNCDIGSSATSSYEGRSPTEPPGPIQSLCQTSIEATDRSASIAAFITTGSDRQLQKVQIAPSGLSRSAHCLYQVENQREEFIMSPHVPAFDPMFPADTAPMT